MKPAFLKYKLHFIFQTIAETSVGSTQRFQKHLSFTEIQGRLDFHRWKSLVANTWQD